MAAITHSTPRVRSFRISSAVAHPTPRPPIQAVPLTARWTKTAPQSPASPAASLPTPPRFRKRKKGLYRSFLVSLGTRKRKIRRSLIRTKEIRHDQELLGDSGGYLPRSCSLPFVAFPGKA